MLDVFVESVANSDHVLLQSQLVLLGLVLWLVVVLNWLARGNVCWEDGVLQCGKSFVGVPSVDFEEFIDYFLVKVWPVSWYAVWVAAELLDEPSQQCLV